MFAAHCFRFCLPAFPVSAAKLRCATVLGLLASCIQPACSANRFNSTENAASSDEGSADSQPGPAASTGRDLETPNSGAPAGDAGATASSRSTNEGTRSSSADATPPGATGASAQATDASAAASADANDAGSDERNGTASSVQAVDSSSSSFSITTRDTTTRDTSRPRAETGSPTAATGDEPSSVVDPAADASASWEATSVASDASPSMDASASETNQSYESRARTAETNDETNEVATGPQGETSAPTQVCSVTRNLPGIVRDFSEDHPDMEPCDEVACRGEKGLVELTLGSDGKPILSEGRREDSTVHSTATFNEWFNDVEGVNTATPFALRITTQRYLPPRKIGFDSADPPPGSPAGFDVNPKGFFPIDELNSTTRPHNYSFTYEVTSWIEYTGGETLTVRGDDDIFVFINRQLVIDLGGIHLPQEATIALDELGLEPNRVYDFRLFFAERHVEQSNLYLSTTARFMSCVDG